MMVQLYEYHSQMNVGLMISIKLDIKNMDHKHIFECV